MSFVTVGGLLAVVCSKVDLYLEDTEVCDATAKTSAALSLAVESSSSEIRYDFLFHVTALLDDGPNIPFSKRQVHDCEACYGSFLSSGL